MNTAHQRELKDVALSFLHPCWLVVILPFQGKASIMVNGNMPMVNRQYKFTKSHKQLQVKIINIIG
jgi:hypothetical protein